MRRQLLLLFATVSLAGATLMGCASTTSQQEATEGPDTAMPARLAVVEVHRSPGCECCHEWETYLRARGYEVRGADDPDIAAFKASLGVPAQAQSCHTATIDGYVVEGHVPIAAIEDLLSDRPEIDGIALPGMPSGSPGMPGEQQEPFAVLALDGGHVSAFDSY